ncbi:MAG: esterase-like activity of phytase family protein [Sphingomonas sp.]
MRAWLLILILFWLNFPTSGPEPLGSFKPGEVLLVDRVPLDRSNPTRTRLGALTYLGGIRLRGTQPPFGGFSAMKIDGDRFMLVSDAGNVLRFRMGKDWIPRDVSFGDLSGGPGTGWLKIDRDSESLTWNPATGQYWVGFEQYNAIWRFAANGRFEAHAEPEPMANWAVNGGPESMVRLRSGVFLVISEMSRPRARRDARLALRFLGDPAEAGTPFERWSYVPPEGYDPTDMAELPDGRLLILNRRVTLRDLFTAKLVIVDGREVRKDAVVRGQEIATFAAPVQHDNFEALAVTQEGKDTILWIASDDNQLWFEESLLLKFRLDTP